MIDFANRETNEQVHTETRAKTRVCHLQILTSKSQILTIKLIFNLLNYVMPDQSSSIFFTLRQFYLG